MPNMISQVKQNLQQNLMFTANETDSYTARMDVVEREKTSRIFV